MAALSELSSACCYPLFGKEGRGEIFQCLCQFNFEPLNKKPFGKGAYAKKGIRCNTVVPGLMHTPLVEYRLTKQLSETDAASLIAKRNAMVPIGRMGTGWDIAHAVLFLVSDEAAFITGTEIVVDGGYTTFGPSGT